MAMLTVLETLLPAERAVFVLREVFDVPYDEIAAAVGKSEAAVRQIAHRARGHVAARRPRSRVSRTEQREVVERFLAALSTGDVQGLLDVLAPDVVLVSDGGGLAGVARKPIAGASRLARFLTSTGARGVRGSAVWLNGSPGFLLLIAGQVVAAVGVSVESGRITRLFAVANPEKLARVGAAAELTRVPDGVVDDGGKMSDPAG